MDGRSGYNHFACQAAASANFCAHRTATEVRADQVVDAVAVKPAPLSSDGRSTMNVDDAPGRRAHWIDDGVLPVSVLDGRRNLGRDDSGGRDAETEASTL